MLGRDSPLFSAVAYEAVERCRQFRVTDLHSGGVRHAAIPWQEAGTLTTDFK
jgi:hypothetical protein